jgi:putative flippase GtrA
MEKNLPITRETITHLVAYAFWGVMTTAVNIAFFFALRTFFATPMLAANFAAWVVAVLFAFVTNRRFVFSSSEQGPFSIAKELLLFISSRAFSGFLDMALMFALIDAAGFAELPVKVAVNGIVIVVNYLTSRFFVFRKKENQ